MVVRSSISEAKGVRWGCEIDSMDNAYRLQNWLNKEGLPPQKLAVQKVDVGGRGLVALKNIRKGEKLLYVPQSLIITSDSAWSSPALGDILRKNSVPEWPFLAIYLINEASLNRSSRWNAYISALPRHPYSILQWSRAEVEMYLAASPVKKQAIECINDVNETHQDLQTRIFSKYPDLFPQKVFNLETLNWAFGILFSRLVRLPSMNNQIALIPWADMLNHSSEVDTYLDFDLSSKGIVFAADRAYQPREQKWGHYICGEHRRYKCGSWYALAAIYWRVLHEPAYYGNEIRGCNNHPNFPKKIQLTKSEFTVQVFISYGKKSNGELLLACGFVPEEGTNADDSVALPLAIDKSDSCYDQKLELLQKYGLSTPQSFPLKMTGWPTQLEAYAFLVVSPPSMAQQFEKLAVAASSTGAFGYGTSFPEELRVKAFQLILDTCETNISKYTSFLQNVQENGSQNLSENGQERINRQSLLRRLSVDLCSSEQRILFRAQYVLRTKLKDLQGVGLKALNVFNGVKRCPPHVQLNVVKDRGADR